MEAEFIDICHRVQNQTFTQQDVNQLREITLTNAIQSINRMSPMQLCEELNRQLDIGQILPPVEHLSITEESNQDLSEATEPTFELWSQLPPRLHTQFLESLVNDPSTLMSLCQSSNYILQTCKNVFITSPEGQPQSLWDYARMAERGQDVEKCLLYQWCRFLLETSTDHWSSDPVYSFTSAILEDRFQNLGRNQKGLIEPQGGRWLVLPQVRSVIDLIPYNQISKIDLLLFATLTYSEAMENPLFLERSSSPFWTILQKVDLYQHYGFPESIEISTKMLSFYQYWLGSSPTNVRYNRTKNPWFIFPMFGTPSGTTHIYPILFLNMDLLKLISPEITPTTNDNDLLDIFVSQKFWVQVIIALNKWMQVPETLICRRINFFKAFRVDLFVRPLFKKQRLYACEILGKVIHYPTNIPEVD